MIDRSQDIVAYRANYGTDDTYLLCPACAHRDAAGDRWPSGYESLYDVPLDPTVYAEALRRDVEGGALCDECGWPVNRRDDGALP